MSAGAKSCCKLMVLRSPLSSRFRSISVHNRLWACVNFCLTVYQEHLNVALIGLHTGSTYSRDFRNLRADWYFEVSRSTGVPNMNSPKIRPWLCHEKEMIG